MSKELPLPKSVKVACYTIHLENWHPHSANASRRYGEFSSMEQLIKVDLSSTNDTVINTLIHELFHAIYWAYSIMDDDKEERTVEMLATGWQQVMVDNPKLREYIDSLVSE